MKISNGMEVLDKLKFNSFSTGKVKKKCLIFFHGWSGDMDSFIPFAKSTKVSNAEWFFPQAPYTIENGYSWSYEISEGVWEREEPLSLVQDFLDTHIFSIYNSKEVYLFGFSQGAMVCYELLKEIDNPLGGVFPIGGFMRDSDAVNLINVEGSFSEIIIKDSFSDGLDVDLQFKSQQRIAIC